MFFYLSLDLHHLNTKVCLQLPVRLYSQSLCCFWNCSPALLHTLGFLSQTVYKNASTTSADGCTIPVVWSSFRQLHIKTHNEDGNFVNFHYPKYVLSGITSFSTTGKMALVNARTLSNKTFILSDFFLTLMPFICDMVKEW